MNVILASASPRRVELLGQFHISFKAIPSDIEEIVRHGETPIQNVMGLSLEKALKLSCDYKDSLIIACDTVVFDGRILNKPRDREDAKMMLMSLSGKDHEVYTGVALVHVATNRKFVDYVCTKVRFVELSEEDIDLYLKTGEADDKAGAYGIQGYGALLVDKIDGDFFNVMGLPLSKLNVLLKKHFQLDLIE
ncbi:MAG TPA: septum formation protein Maf [Clostridiales bacterium UBA8960]|jgi:septum formation protein|nr:septum formation protein Maf [Clostridiales bacterium UBA8960]